MSEEKEQTYWCKICKRNRQQKFIDIFDVFEGCVCCTCIKKLYKGGKNWRG